MTPRLALAIAAAALMFAAVPVLAQSADDEGVSFGLEVGITRANIKADNLEDFFQSRTGMMGGIWFGGNRNGTAGLMGEISYVVKKAGNNADDDIDFHYIEIPVLLRVNIGQTSTRNGLIVYPLFGPVVDIQLKGKINSLDVKDQFKGVNVGVIGGVGLEVARIGVEARINWGLRSLEKTDGGFSDWVDIKSRTAQVLLKLRLN